MEKVDFIYHSRTPGIGARGVPDQYADGKAAKVWQKYIGDQKQRTEYYKEKLLTLLKEHNVKKVFDVACGTGIDSVLLLENGFEVVSVDASDKMLKYALKTRWERRKEEAFDKWVIEEGNWLHLNDAAIEKPKGGFDALICMGNSFAHLPDTDGTQVVHYQAIENFFDCLRPGGILVIDHRNYDYIVAGNKAPMKNIYYQSCGEVDCKTSVIMVDGKYHMITLDYNVHQGEAANGNEFRLSYYPHLLKNFNKMIADIFGEKMKHTVLGDFEPLGQIKDPSMYVHICQKPW